MLSPDRHALVALSRRARADLRSISVYGTNAWGETASQQYRDQLNQLFTKLARFPELGRGVELTSGDIRAISVGIHVVYYQYDSGTIRIVRVLHRRMQVTEELLGQ